MGREVRSGLLREPHRRGPIGVHDPDVDVALADLERRMVLSGRAADGLVETGPVICACFGVGLGVIRDAIASNSATDVEAIGKALRAGTNCGSCVPELKRIVHEHAHAV